MSGAGRKPNLFIVGAPKSGTTALWTYLGRHPDIFTPGEDQLDSDLPAAGGKEYQYFGSDLASNIDTKRTLESYLAVFARATDERYLLDASPMYLCSELAAAEIAAFSPDARAIAVLRNPVDMMYSLHGEALFQGDEDIVDFEGALDAEDDRHHGKRIPPTCQGALWSLYYRDVARYADQVERFFDALGRDRVHVIIFDDLASDPAAAYRATLAFLDIDVDESQLPDFTVRNAHKAPRSQFAVRMMRNPPPVLRTVTRVLVRNQATRRALGFRALELNADKRPREPMQPELRSTLQTEFTGDIERLGKLLGRDLSSWLEPASDGQQTDTTDTPGRF
jgi:hypothetical protein